MKRIKDFLGVLIYPVILLLVQFGLILLFTLIFNITNNYEIGSIEYVENLGIFFTNNKLWLAVLTFLLLIPLFKKKCTIKKLDFDLKNMILLILLGISFGLTYNLILINLNYGFNFTNIFDESNSNIIITVLASGIIGPIMEELIFRNIVYERFKKLYKPVASIILTGIIFGIFHGNIIQFIYVFLFNFILVFVYEKYQSIYAPIIVHISANVGLQLFLNFVNYNNIYTNIFSLIINLIVLLISYKKMNKSELKD